MATVTPARILLRRRRRFKNLEFNKLNQASGGSGGGSVQPAGYFGHRYFGAQYFGQHYFGGGAS